MPNLTTVGLTAGAGSSGTGNVSTLDNVIGTAGTASPQVLTVQGIASGTAQPVSLASVPSHAVTNAGTFAVQASAGTNLNTSALALETGGNLATIATNTAASTPAGTAVIGKVGIDQTSVGTTNAVSLSQIGATTILNGGVAGSQSMGGTVATNVAINSNPLNLGAQAVSSENTAVTTARQVQLTADLVGKLIVLPYANPENFVSGAITTAMTGTTTTSLLAAPAAGLRNYITQITVSNSHATVGTDVIIQDGSGGTPLYTIPAAAVYGGSVITFPTPLRQPTTATAIFCANVTTGASTKVSASGYKGA